MGIPEEVIEDIFQESIIVLYENSQEEGFVLTSKLCTYLCAICKYKGLTWLRKNGKGQNQENMENFADDNEGEEFVYEEKNEGGAPILPEEDSNLPSEEKIREAIDSLGSPCKDLILAVYYHKTRMEELREEFGYKTLNSVKVAKHKCMERLKKILNPKKP
ncbi:sigma-70 family RNA polymerase sigma factor [Catalinimonas sp. 4WD22]|uniref:RNA polymerase sigma factor n=1 Tax=Catalinimonas locisalis TaxID=3133978 RepID=UPI003100D3A8